MRNGETGQFGARCELALLELAVQFGDVRPRHGRIRLLRSPAAYHFPEYYAYMLVRDRRQPGTLAGLLSTLIVVE